MNYQTFGNGKTDLIFLHGWGADISAFLFVAKQIMSLQNCLKGASEGASKSTCLKSDFGFRVTLVDFAGFGKSEEPPHPYSVKNYAGDILRLMEILEINSAILVGHSFGGRVSMEIAANYPHRVKKLVLIDSAGLKPRRKPSYYIKIWTHKFLKKLGFRGLGGSKDYKALSPLMKDTFKKVVNYDQSNLLPNIECPTAIFWGRKDKETPLYMAKRLNKGIKDSMVFWLDGGHFSYAEDFSKFFPIFYAFISTEDKKSSDKADCNGGGRK